MNYYCKNTKFGFITIKEVNNLITEISFGEQHGLNSVDRKLTPLIELTFNQLEEYFSGKRYEFNLPYKLLGTEFQKKVWVELSKIPYGATCSYKDIATKIGNPLASRAVGMANNKNPIAIIIPCHRVIGTNGKLTGYAGGLDIKQELLYLESVSKMH